MPGTARPWALPAGAVAAAIAGPDGAPAVAAAAWLLALTGAGGRGAAALAALGALLVGAALAGDAARRADGAADVVLVGVVERVRADDDGRARALVLRVEDCRPAPSDACRVRRLRLALFEPLATAPGERWRLPVRVRAPAAAANPGRGPPELRAWRDGVHARGYVRGDPPAQRLAPAPDPGPVGRLRSGLSARLAAATDGRAALLRALLLGDRTALTPAHWRDLALGGTTHLFVVSGLHVALVAAVVAGLLRLAGHGPATGPGAVGAGLAAGGYVLLSGAGLPAQRAFGMLAVALLASVGDRAPRAGAALGWAASAVLVLDPRAVLDLGLWLSLIAVAALLAGTGRRRGALRAAAGVQLRVTAVLTVPLVAAFGWLPLAAPAVNLLAVPLVAALVLPLGLLALAGLVLGLPGAGALLARLESLLAAVLEAAAAVGGPVTPATPSVIAGAIALAAVALAVLPLPPALRGAALALALGLAAVPPPAPPPGQFRVHVLDVGQGLSVLVRTRRHAVLFDAGPRFVEDGPDAGALLVAPALRALGVHRVDLLLVSHGDADHAGGVPGLRRALPVRRVRGPPPIAGRAGPCATPLRRRLDGVVLEVLHPDPGAGAGADNRRSCVLRVRGATASALLPGDVDRWVERRLAPRIGAVDLVVAPHHGSRSSSGRALVRHARPRLVVFPAGSPSAFGHPHPDVVARWRSAGARTVVTGAAGMVVWDSRAPAEVRCWRATRDGWWRARSAPAVCGGP